MKSFKHADQEQDSWEQETSFQMQQLLNGQTKATPTEKRFLKALHWMRCPRCGHELATERHGSVDIDFCPDCRGVWLDTVALEAIVAPANDFLRSCLRDFHHRAQQ